MKNLVTVDIEVIKLVRDVRNEQKRYFMLSSQCRKNPDLYREKKECLKVCFELEKILDMHIENILEGPKMKQGQIEFPEI